MSVPITVSAVDAFGKEAVEKLYPDWEFRNDLTEADFEKVATESPRKFSTDGTSLFPGETVAAFKTGFSHYEAKEALQTFGLALLGEASERGIAALTPSGIRRHNSRDIQKS